MFRLLLLIVVVILIFCYDASRGFSSLMIPSLPENTEKKGEHKEDDQVFFSSLLLHIIILRDFEDPCL